LFHLLLFQAPACFAFGQGEGNLSVRESHFTSNYLGTFSRDGFLLPSSYSAQSGTHLSTSHLLFLNYRISQDYLFGAVGGFEATPTRESKWLAYNPSLRFGKNSVLGNFKLFADFRMAVPVTDEARKQKMITYLQTTPILSYRQPHSRIAFGSFNRFRYHFYRQDQVGRKMVLYDRSWISYQMNDHWNASFMSILQFVQSNGKSSFRMDPWRVGPGVSWNLNPGFVVSPSLMFEPMDPQMRTVSLSAMVSARIL
jgi:hypothetical protein